MTPRRKPVLQSVHSKLSVLLFVFLTACSLGGLNPANDEAASQSVVQAEPGLETASHPPTRPTQPSSVPASPVTAQPARTPTTVLTLEVESPPFTDEPLPFQVCSPLAIHSLDELPEIISDPYRPPPPGKEQRHHGVDFSYYRRGDRLSIQGVVVQSVLPGFVAATLSETFPYGNLVIIETPFSTLPAGWVEALLVPPGYSIYTLYAHMEHPPAAALGEGLGACHPLGEVGVSGNTVEPHLHLEMRLGAAGARFTSMGFYKADDTQEERSNYVRWRTSGEFQHFDPLLVLTGLSGVNEYANPD